MSLQIPHREKHANGTQPLTKAVILVSAEAAYKQHASS
jgi:hypothetical protein